MGGSVRKCADTSAVNTPNGPDQATVMMRAGHSLGGVQDRYQKVDHPAVDCFCGRVLTMVPMTTAEFAVMPPHFDKAGLAMLEEIGWKNIIYHYDSYGNTMKRVLPMLLATLVFHKANGNLEELLPEDHPIFSEAIFSQDKIRINELKNHIHLGYNGCCKCNMVATGVSPFVTILIQFEKLKESVENKVDELSGKSDIIHNCIRKYFAVYVIT